MTLPREEYQIFHPSLSTSPGATEVARGNLCIDNLATPSSTRNTVDTPLGLIVRERSQAWTDRHGAFASSPKPLTSVGLPCPVLISVASSPALRCRGRVAEPPIISITILYTTAVQHLPTSIYCNKNNLFAVTDIFSSRMSLYSATCFPSRLALRPGRTEPPLCAYRLRSWP